MKKLIFNKLQPESNNLDVYISVDGEDYEQPAHTSSRGRIHLQTLGSLLFDNIQTTYCFLLIFTILLFKSDDDTTLHIGLQH